MDSLIVRLDTTAAYPLVRFQVASAPPLPLRSPERLEPWVLWALLLAAVVALMVIRWRSIETLDI